jgi:hypothetical protein
MRKDFDLSTIDGIVDALYSSISGPPGGQDWALERLVNHPKASKVRTRIENGKPVAYPFGVEDFIEATIPLLAARSFHEIEIARKTVRFGNVAQVFSAYEAKDTPESKTLIKRGMNLIHLWNDGARWWVMHMIWDDEREGVKLPPQSFFDQGKV